VHHSDILAYAPEASYDVLCTHHFFNYFPPERRPALVAKWHALLRPGATLIVINRFRNADRAPNGVGNARWRRLNDAAIAAARENARSLDLPADALVEMIADYRRRIRAYCLDTEDELSELLERGGFAVETYVNLAQHRIAARGEESADAVGAIARRL
jgi:hypothetical protein